MGKRKENSTNMLNENYITESCNLTYAVCKIGGRWKLLILCKLENGKLRFSELRNQIKGITERMLTLQLRELEKEGLIKRTVYAEVPPRVDYELTEIAKELVPIWNQLSNWGAKHKEILLSSVSSSI
ncbi:winged helix-turn-helix transcriptional regulator [Flavobacterium quisquiliarum]|uniref:Winged helix-turn-helix transcriptional regulator n=1 Tax=Flavobacterium quisquiliarum TaxID=1834436 RepID=A0ABV8W202_9FLAO|nr:helix-turn-helix domain-containing protein [Flavobacterium quisquiliarum]MBW1655420.1 transcriptional regulator [Flavobacterium quisquiliarum]NWL03044.1 transcriptional regulator [Flavobacterium collinsii]